MYSLGKLSKEEKKDLSKAQNEEIRKKLKEFFLRNGLFVGILKFMAGGVLMAFPASFFIFGLFCFLIFMCSTSPNLKPTVMIDYINTTFYMSLQLGLAVGFIWMLFSIVNQSIKKVTDAKLRQVFEKN